jgi:hypothetical protein
MELVEDLLRERKWENRCLRSNIVPPDKIKMWKTVKVALCESNAPRKDRVIDRKLTAAIEAIAPEWWGEGDTRISMNRNVKCEKHRDGNKGYSYILWLGDFVGGALVFEDGTRIEEKYKWHKINGQIPHWNEDHEGTKYSIIIYQGESSKKKTQCIADRIKAKREREKKKEESQEEATEVKGLEPGDGGTAAKAEGWVGAFGEQEWRGVWPSWPSGLG